MTRANEVHILYMTPQRRAMLRLLLQAEHPLSAWTVSQQVGTGNRTALDSLNRFTQWGWTERTVQWAWAEGRGPKRYLYRLTDTGRLGAGLVLQREEET